MNGNEPATKQDLQLVGDQLRSEFRTMGDQLRSEFRTMGDQLRSEFLHGFDDLKEAIRDSQTELLKAFYSFTTSYQERLTQGEVTDAAITKRLGTLEARVTELERKINFPNQ